MQKFLFSPEALPNVSIVLDQSGRIITPEDNGFLGVFRHGTKITLRLKVKGEHNCFTLNPQGLQKVPKAKNELGYTKNFTIDCSTGTGQIARWPANMVCLEVPGNTYNIGIANQNGRFFFVIEEYSPSPENLPEGMVVSFSLLRGVGTVALKPGFDARIHWTAVPFNRILGLRLMQTGDFLQWKKEDLVTLGGETTFRYEIKQADNLSQIC